MLAIGDQTARHDRPLGIDQNRKWQTIGPNHAPDLQIVNEYPRSAPKPSRGGMLRCLRIVACEQ